jgi:hypothetical protein
MMGERAHRTAFLWAHVFKAEAARYQRYKCTLRGNPGDSVVQKVALQKMPTLVGFETSMRTGSDQLRSTIRVRG